MMKIMRDILKSGDWAQCKFCKQALPTKKKSKSPSFNQNYKGDVIEESGYCTYCETNGLKP